MKTEIAEACKRFSPLFMSNAVQADRWSHTSVNKQLSRNHRPPRINDCTAQTSNNMARKAH
jgi:hypothetical protein